MTTGERTMSWTRTTTGRAAAIGAAVVTVLGGMALSPWAPTTSAAGAPYTSTAANGNDDLKSSWYPNESGLTPGLVTGGTFGQLWDAPLDQPSDAFPDADQLYGQPLVYTNPATGAATVVAASEANQLYGFDAVTGQRRYKVSLGPTFDPATLPCTDLMPRIGITGTPAVDLASGTGYVLSKQTAGGTTRYVAYGYDVETGAVAWSTPIAGEAQNAPGVTFEATVELQRPGLLIHQGVLYAAFGGHCDVGNYRGWVVGVDIATHRIVAMWAAQPASGDGAGIWQSGGGIMSDGPGRLFVATGNSYHGGAGANTPPSASGNVPAALGQAVVRLDVQGDRSLRAGSFFMPYDAEQLDTNDLDFGSGGPVAIAAESLPPALRSSRVLVAVGKQGYVYVLDRDALGGYRQGPGGADQVVSRVGPDGGVWSKPAVWPGEADDGGYVYIVTASNGTISGGTQGFFNTYKVVTGAGNQPSLQRVATAADTFGFSSGAPIITSSGTAPGTGIVWTVWTPGSSSTGAELRAYRAVPDGSTMTLLGRWPVGLASKFASPVASGNRVFVGTRDGHLKAFGSPVEQSIVSSTPVFPATVTGQAATTTVTITANVDVTLTAIGATHRAFTVGTASPALPARLAAGTSLTVPVTFAPSVVGPVSGQLVVESDAGNLTVPISGRGVAPNGRLAANPAAVSMGGSPVGATISGSFTMTNVGASALTITDISSPSEPFFATAPGLPYALAPGASVQVGLTFAPTAPGAYVSSVAVTSDGGSLTIPVTASSASLGHRTLAPAAVAFPDTLVGGHRDRGFTLGNDGGSPYTVSISKPPSGGQFSGSVAALPEGSTVDAGSLRVLPVRFAPTAPGTHAGGWDLSTTEGSGRTILPVSGTGIASVALPAPGGGAGWTANGSASVAADGSLVLTGDATAQTGTAWFATPVTTGHLEAHFDAFLDGETERVGEGLTFAIADADQVSPTAVGGAGEGLGFAGTGGLAVALVGHDTPTDQADLVGVVVTSPGGARQWLAPPVSLSPALHAGTPGGRPVPVDVWIDRASDGTATITVLVDGTPVVVGLPAPVPQRAYLGFTASTTADTAERHAVGATPTILTDGLAVATCPESFDGWKGEYFADADLAGSPVACRDDALVSFDWADGAPAPGLPADHFSARWTKTIVTGARSYTFTTGSDDGSRLYIDGRLVLNAWKVQTYTPRSTRVLLTSGVHTVVYEYFDSTGPARALLGIR